MAKGFLRDSTTGLAGIILSILLTAAVGLSSVRAEGPKFDPGFKAAVLTTLCCCFLGSLIFIQRSVHECKDGGLGPLQARPVGGDPRASTALRTASIYVLGLHGALICVYSLLFYGHVPCYHTDPVRNRPINTLRFIEWSFSVPILMWVLGHDLLQLPCHQVLAPIIHTCVYIWLAWVGQLVIWSWARALIISTCFTIVMEASMAQQRWHKPGHPLKSLALAFQMVFFAMYGAVYMIALADMITPATEDVLYTCFDVTAKMGHTVLIVLMGRTSDIDCFLQVEQSCQEKHVQDMMQELRSAAGVHFDLLIQCRNSPQGLIIGSTSSALEWCMGKDLKGLPLLEVCFNEADRRRLQEHRISQAPSSPIKRSKEPQQQQKNVALHADMLRVGLQWIESPTGSIPAELFAIETAPNAAGRDDVVFIGVRLLQKSKSRLPPSAAEARWAHEIAPDHQLPHRRHLLASALDSKFFATGHHEAVAVAPQAALKLPTTDSRGPPNARGSEPGVNLLQGFARGGWKRSGHRPAIPRAGVGLAAAGEPPCSLAAPAGPPHAARLSNLGSEWEDLVLSESDVELMEVLGHGSLGEVRKVRWRGETYTQKVLEKAQWNPKKRGVWHKVHREASILSASAEESHPHLCQLVGVVTCPRISFVFELCSGGSMHGLLRARQLVTWAHRLAIIRQTAGAIKHLHDFDIIHRDLKSSNILLFSHMTPETTPNVKVTDVGLTRWFQPTESDSGSCGCDSSGTRSGGATGRPDAPATLAKGRRGAAGLAPALPEMRALPLPLPASNANKSSTTHHNNFAISSSGSGSSCRAPELRTGLYGSAVDIYALGVFLLQLSAWTNSLPHSWPALLKTLPKPQGRQEVAHLAESCLAEEAASRPTAREVLHGVEQRSVPEAEQFGILWAVHLAGDDDT